MVNLWKTIGKLQKFEQNMSGRGTSLPSQLEDMAVFVRTDLSSIITELLQQQADDDRREMELAAELREEQSRLNYELDQSVEEGSYASLAVG